MCAHDIAQIPFVAFFLQRVCGPVGPHSAFAPPSHPAMGAFRHALSHLPLHGGAVSLPPFILPLQMKACLRFGRQQIGVPAEAAYPLPQNPPARRPDPSRKRCHAGVLLGAHIHTVALTIGKHLATNL